MTPGEIETLCIYKQGNIKINLICKQQMNTIHMKQPIKTRNFHKTSYMGDSENKGRDISIPSQRSCAVRPFS